MTPSHSDPSGNSLHSAIRVVLRLGRGRGPWLWLITLVGTAWAQSVEPGTSATSPVVRPAAADSQAAPVAPAACVYLTTRPTNTGEGVDAGILLRELFRQALLIAARDELGLQTRDMTLRESPAFGADAANSAPVAYRPLDLDVVVKIGQAVRLELRRGPGPDGPVAWAHAYPLTAKDEVDYTEVVRLAERLARQDFVEALQAAGVRGTRPPRNADAVLSATVAQQLDDLSPLTQFVALRAAHAGLRHDGESSALCGVLVRGYANLSLSTAMLWNTGYKAYGARALLYAERMVAADPQSPAALWHRAYARALVGLHAAALEDLAQAEDLARASAIQAPRWVMLISLYCRYDAHTLAGEGVLGQSTSHLADLLAGVAGAQCLGQRAYARLARDIVTRNAECYRVLDDFLERSGVSDANWVTQRGPLTLTTRLPWRMRRMPELPESVQATLPPPARAPSLLAKLLGIKQRGPKMVAESYLENLPGIWDALRAAGAPDQDEGEPSWAALGSQLEDLTFLHVQRRAHFIAHTWGLPADSFIESAEPLIASHPYALAVLGSKTRYKDGGAALAELWRDLLVTDADFPLRPMLRPMRQLPKGEVRDRGQAAWDRMFWHTDAIAADLEHTCTGSKQRAPAAARRLLTISPHAPGAIVALITYDWKDAADQASGWEREYQRCAPLLEALARQYLQLKRVDDARRMLRVRCDLSMDYWAWTTLAYLYREDGDVGRWKEMLETYLGQYEEENLEHAHIRDELARYYMSQGDYAAALPYAEVAAESGAAWAMNGAAFANEGLRRWKAAEQWYRSVSERYPDNTLEWLLFCVRTGQGQRRAAEELATKWARHLADDAPEIPLGEAAVLHMLRNQDVDARRLLERNFERTGSPLYGHFLATLKAGTGQSGQSEQWFAQIIERTAKSKLKGDAVRPELVELAKIFQRGEAAGALRPVDLQDITALLDSAAPKRRSGVLYFTARFLERHGDAEQARVWLKRTAEDPVQINWTVCLARELCRTRGVALEPVPPRVEPVSHQP